MIIGKDQSVVPAVSDEQSFDYWVVKDAILQAIELIPEGYRQKFRNLQKT